MSKATSLGNLSLVLQVPRTCENFVILCKRGYYDGTGVWGGVGCVLAWGEEGRKWFLATSCCDGAEVWCYQRSCPGLPSSVSRLPFSSPSSLALLPFVPCVSLLPLSPLSFPSFLPLPYSFPPSSLSPILSLQYFTDPSGISWYVHTLLYNRPTQYQYFMSDVTVFLLLDTRGRPHWYW